MNQEHDQNKSQDQAQGGGGKETTPSQSDSRSVAEWTTLGFSIAILLGIFGLITYLYVRGDERPPIIVAEARLDELRTNANLYYLPVDVMNQGDRTAEAAQIQAELDAGSGQPEMAEFTVSFLAGGEKVRGTFIFQNDPEQGELTVRAISYKEP